MLSLISLLKPPALAASHKVYPADQLRRGNPAVEKKPVAGAGAHPFLTSVDFAGLDCFSQVLGFHHQTREETPLCCSPCDRILVP